MIKLFSYIKTNKDLKQEIEALKYQVFNLKTSNYEMKTIIKNLKNKGE